jgi:hypothetical protein
MKNQRAAAIVITALAMLFLADIGCSSSTAKPSAKTHIGEAAIDLARDDCYALCDRLRTPEAPCQPKKTADECYGSCVSAFASSTTTSCLAEAHALMACLATQPILCVDGSPLIDRTQGCTAEATASNACRIGQTLCGVAFGSGYWSDACTNCKQTTCCAARMTCAADPDCVGFLACGNSCEIQAFDQVQRDDIRCTHKCIERYKPTKAPTEIAAISGCELANCDNTLCAPSSGSSGSSGSSSGSSGQMCRGRGDPCTGDGECCGGLCCGDVMGCC